MEDYRSQPPLTIPPVQSFSIPPHIPVVQAKLPGNMLGCTNGQTIWLDSDLSPTEARCALAHELVHIELGHSSAQPANVETYVERVAASRLVPIEALARTLFDCFDLTALAERLDVTIDVIASRLESLTDSERLVIRRRLLDLFADPEAEEAKR